MKWIKDFAIVIGKGQWEMLQQVLDVGRDIAWVLRKKVQGVFSRLIMMLAGMLVILNRNVDKYLWC